MIVSHVKYEYHNNLKNLNRLCEGEDKFVKGVK